MFKKYLQYRKNSVPFFVLSVIFLALFLSAIGLLYVVSPIFFLVSAFLFIAYILICVLALHKDFSLFKTKQTLLENATADYENIIAKLPHPENICEESYYTIVATLCKRINDADSRAGKEIDALYRYLTCWLNKSNEIKAMHNEMLTELSYSTLKNYILAISGGFTASEVSVDEIVQRSAMKFNPVFMEKKLGIGVKKIGLTAHCGAEALTFILDALMLDCLLRTEKGGVKLYADKSGENALIIEDSSEGSLSSEELFRESNTVVHTVLAVCKSLGVNCESASSPGHGTAFRLDFSA